MAETKKTEKKPETKTEDNFWDIDPLQSLADVVLGAAFDGPKKLTEEVVKTETTTNGNETKPSERHTTNVNVTLDGLFKSVNGKSKPKPKQQRGDGTSKSEEEGTSAGVEESDDDE